MAKMSKTGVYTDADGNRYIGKDGDTLPEGWSYAGPRDGDDDPEGVAPVVEARSLGAAPENKAQRSAPENRVV